jgi:hypothetical protein
MKLIHVAFAIVATIVPLSMVFVCGDIFPCGSILLEESLAFMEGIGDKRKMTP